MYWAGWRFGHRLAESAKQPGAPASALWNPKQIERAERWMESKGMFVVFIARATEFFTLPVNLVAGASEMRSRRFLVAHTLGAVGFAALVLWLGDLAKEPVAVAAGLGRGRLRAMGAPDQLGLIVLLVVAMPIGQKVKPQRRPHLRTRRRRLPKAAATVPQPTDRRDLARGRQRNGSVDIDGHRLRRSCSARRCARRAGTSRAPPGTRS